jgi:transposase
VSTCRSYEKLLHEWIYNTHDLRTTLEGMPYRIRVGCPWRALVKAFGRWSKVYKRSITQSPGLSGWLVMAYLVVFGSTQ